MSRYDWFKLGEDFQNKSRYHSFKSGEDFQKNFVVEMLSFTILTDVEQRKNGATFSVKKLRSQKRLRLIIWKLRRRAQEVARVPSPSQIDHNAFVGAARWMGRVLRRQ